MADANPLNVPSPQPLPPTLEPATPTVPDGIAGPTPPAATQVESPQTGHPTPVANVAAETMSTGVQSVMSTPAATPALTATADLTSPIGGPGLAHEPADNARIVGVTPPTITKGLQPTPRVDDVDGEPTNPQFINQPSTPPIVSSGQPVDAPDPTLATAGPVQGSAPPRIAGKQMTPQTPPADQSAARPMQTPAPNTATLTPISTMRQS